MVQPPRLVGHLIIAPYLWLLVFFLIPFLIVLAMSFATRTPTAPPFGYGGENPVFNVEGYARLFHGRSLSSGPF